MRQSLIDHHTEALQAAQQPVAEWLKDFNRSMSTMGFHESDPVAMVEGVVRAYLEALYDDHADEHWTPADTCVPCCAETLLDGFA